MTAGSSVNGAARSMVAAVASSRKAASSGTHALGTLLALTATTDECVFARTGTFQLPLPGLFTTEGICQGQIPRPSGCEGTPGLLGKLDPRLLGIRPRVRNHRG